MTIEAMKQALEVLELINLEFVCANGAHHAKKDRHEWDEDCPITDRWRKAITALRTAIEQAEKQEPLEYWNAVEGWVKIDEVREHFDSVGCGTIYKTAGDGRVPLTAAKRPWVGLTDEEIDDLAEFYGLDFMSYASFTRAIEAKLKEKNT